jgi:Arc/MetJ-type ribon-helix-helix transcriptional regulator
MPLGYKNLSISLPDELVSMVEGLRLREHRSRSEVMREALRLYFERRGLIEDPLPGELEAVEEARVEDEYVTLAEARRELDLPRR